METQPGISLSEVYTANGVFWVEREGRKIQIAEDSAAAYLMTTNGTLVQRDGIPQNLVFEGEIGTA